MLSSFVQNEIPFILFIWFFLRICTIHLKDGVLDYHQRYYWIQGGSSEHIFYIYIYTPRKYHSMSITFVTEVTSAHLQFILKDFYWEKKIQ